VSADRRKLRGEEDVYLAAMRPTFFRSFILAPAFFLVGCGPGRLSDADVTRFCELTVRCSSGLLSQASCEASLETQRDAANRQGCGGQLGAVARCAIRADECATGVPESCRDEQMRLETCLERRMPDAGPGGDAGTGATCTRAEVEGDYALCSDGCDNDGNGVFDCDEETCCGSIGCEPGTECGGGSCTNVREVDYSYCTDGCDNDGNGVFDCDDSGCCEALAGSCPSGTRCGETTCTTASETTYSYCADGCDNDGDGVFDCDDSGCCEALAGSCPSTSRCGEPTCTTASETTYSYCADGCDNDGDGVFDCDDSGCCSALAGSCPSGTRCASGPAEEVLARNSSGYLEVYYMGQWRPVCDDSFDMTDANVACRMLGYSTASSFRTVTGASDLFWLDELRCTGSESSLADCPRSDWGVEDCSASESVQVVCY
jgi:hypothetical protein